MITATTAFMKVYLKNRNHYKDVHLLVQHYEGLVQFIRISIRMDFL